jgi:hypothetical protein
MSTDGEKRRARLAQDETSRPRPYLGYPGKGVGGAGRFASAPALRDRKGGFASSFLPLPPTGSETGGSHQQRPGNLVVVDGKE